MRGILNPEASSKVIGVQFSIMSPAEIRRGSVAAITSRDTYAGTRPVVGGLFDARMGVLEPGQICPTDGLDYMQTPGYFGHIDLARPVFYIQYLNTVLKIVRCVCFKCSQLLISRSRYQAEFGHLPASKRWSEVFAVASKVQRCGNETTDGCGCRQPHRIRREGLATITAEWTDMEESESEDGKMTVPLDAEAVLRILSKISNDDMAFMGFDPVWSRPEWMICQVLSVPPPAVRPSVKHDSQQRSEDDLTHILVNILKANKTLNDKLEAGAAGNVIDDWTTVLQYYVATLVDNKIPGVAAVAQRSGRPLKAIKERLNGKAGRVRGNLMGKRVDFSARSVITPDPNLSVTELGVPLRVAMNITTPVVVTESNRRFLLKLVQNGPDVHPGAKTLDRHVGGTISLRYVDRMAISLEIGDVVHRHMMDGDPVLFNRQPTLHRMSMMCHLVRVLRVGETFRLNVACTKPYNADFDGDEMNLHMPQGPAAAAELRHLAAVPWQMVSPANNKTIVGVFQDSLLGAYRITRPGQSFTRREAMNLLMCIDNVDMARFPAGDRVSCFELLSQIMPPLSLKYTTRAFEDGDDIKNSDAVLEIQNGVYKRGQLDKAVLGDGSKGLVHRICNDFGNPASTTFLDNLQGIVTDFMRQSGYSVGISDLIADAATSEAIAEAITDKKLQVKSLIDKTLIGAFDNQSGRTNAEAFEQEVNSTLNAATNAAGKIGRSSLDPNNRFVIMINAGSKGSELNISQMVACLGQQNVDGKRIPYGFTDRTLPHFTKFDDSPIARGFVESSFISGLTPEELFFHAMGGREGLIDTAVKTSQTGYIQRRLIKSLEDVKVEYDGTVRNAMGKVIAFRYGDDGIDSTKVEAQTIRLMSMSTEDIYAFCTMSTESVVKYTAAAGKRLSKQQAALERRQQEAIDRLLAVRLGLVQDVFKYREGDKVYLPVGLKHIVNNVHGQMHTGKNSLVDITPLECYQVLDKAWDSLSSNAVAAPTDLFRGLWETELSPSELLGKRRFNKKSLEVLCSVLTRAYLSSVVAPGEMVGLVAAQSIGEPTTQMTLNTFHFAGVASKSNVTRGVPRIEEILSLSENPKNPSCTVHLWPQDERERSGANAVCSQLEHTRLRTVVSRVSICFDPDPSRARLESDRRLVEDYLAFEEAIGGCDGVELVASAAPSKWVIRLELDPIEMIDHDLTINDIAFAISQVYGPAVSCVFSDHNAENLVFRIRLSESLAARKKTGGAACLDKSDELCNVQAFRDQLLDDIVLRGIKGITKATARKIPDTVTPENGKYVRTETWVVDTVGTNLLEILATDGVDASRTYTNDIQEIHRVLGVEAARQAIFNEIQEVMNFDSTYINYHHLSLLCDRMACNDNLVSVFRHGINNDHIGPLAKASFEETPEMFLRAARHAETDPMRGLSANVMCGQEGNFGTHACRVLVNPDSLRPAATATKEVALPPEFDLEMASDDPCATQNIEIHAPNVNRKETDLGDVGDYDMGF